LGISEKVPHDISDRLMNKFCNTLVEEFNSTFKTITFVSKSKMRPWRLLQIA